MEIDHVQGKEGHGGGGGGGGQGEGGKSACPIGNGEKLKKLTSL